MEKGRVVFVKPREDGPCRASTKLFVAVEKTNKVRPDQLVLDLSQEV